MGVGGGERVWSQIQTCNVTSAPPLPPGWIAKLKVTEESGYEALMTEQAYLKMLEEEAD